MSTPSARPGRTGPRPTGYRATVDALGPGPRDRLRAALLAELRARGVTTLRTDVVFGTAIRPR